MDDVAGPVSLPDVVAAALTAASPLLRDQHVTVSTAIDVTDREIPPLRGRPLRSSGPCSISS